MNFLTRQLKTANILPLALLAGAAFMVVKEVKGIADKVKFSFLDISFLNKESAQSGYASLFFKLKLKINNQSATTINLREVKAKFSKDGKNIAEIFKTDNLPIPAGKEIAGAVTIKLPTLAIFQTVSTALKEIFQRKPVIIKILGAAKFDQGTVNIDETKKLTW